jgi:PqqD family protein of HPr-rel-A system
MADDSMWRLAADAAPPIRCWQGDFVVYNPLSGDTHIFDIVAGTALEAVAAGPTSSAAVCRRVASLLDVPNDEQVAANVDVILARLDDLGLIEPADVC